MIEELTFSERLVIHYMINYFKSYFAYSLSVPKEEGNMKGWPKCLTRETLDSIMNKTGGNIESNKKKYELEKQNQ